MNYLAFIVRTVHVCVEKQSAVKPRDAIGGKEEEPALIVVSWRNTQRSLPLPYRLPYPKKYLFIFWADTSLFLYIFFCFWIFNFSYFHIIIIIIRCSGMFRKAPWAPLHVPDFIDDLVWFNIYSFASVEIDKNYSWTSTPVEKFQSQLATWPAAINDKPDEREPGNEVDTAAILNLLIWNRRKVCVTRCHLRIQRCICCKFVSLFKMLRFINQLKTRRTL